MGFFQEFKEFAVKGNVVDLAVGIIIGAAFGSIVKSLVDDIIMPIVGLLTRGVDYSQRYWVLRQGNTALVGNETVAQAKAAGAVTLNYGMFINNIVTFIIVSFAVFILVKQINRLRRQKKNKPVDPTDKNCPHCFQTIPIKATRCPHCTSALPAPTAAQTAAANEEGKPT